MNSISFYWYFRPNSPVYTKNTVSIRSPRIGGHQTRYIGVVRSKLVKLVMQNVCFKNRVYLDFRMDEYSNREFAYNEDISGTEIN